MGKKKLKETELVDSFKITTETNFVEDDFANGPIVVTKNDKKDKVTIYNYFNEDVEGALLSITDGKDNDMPILELPKLESLTAYVIEVPVDRFTSISNSLNLDNLDYRLVRLPKNYEDGKKDKSKNLFYNTPVEEQVKEEEKMVEEPKEEEKKEEKSVEPTPVEEPTTPSEPTVEEPVKEEEGVVTPRKKTFKEKVFCFLHNSKKMMIASFSLIVVVFFVLLAILRCSN